MSKSLTVVVAATVGFVAGILLAPKSGKETRREIKEKAADAKKIADIKADQVKATVKDSVKAIKSGSKEVSTQAQAFASSAKSSAERVGSEVKDLSSEAKERVSGAAQTARQTAKTIQHDAKKRLS